MRNGDCVVGNDIGSVVDIELTKRWEDEGIEESTLRQVEGDPGTRLAIVHVDREVGEVKADEQGKCRRFSCEGDEVGMVVVDAGETAELYSSLVSERGVKTRE